MFRVENDTLWSIARQAGVTVETLKSLNHLQSDTIYWHTGVLVPENELTRSLPLYLPQERAPEWRECRDVSWVPATRTRVEFPIDDFETRCLETVCTGEFCACMKLEQVDHSWKGQLLTDGDRDIFPRDDATMLHARVNLDDDPEPESVLAIRNAISNGIAVETWKVRVASKGQVTAALEMNDFGLSFIAHGHRCALIRTLTDWRTDQLRGNGLYFTAREYELANGALQPVGPEVVRRYTARFASQRWDALDAPPTRLVPLFADQGAFIWTQPLDEPSPDDD